MSRLPLGNLFFNLSINSSGFDDSLARTQASAQKWAAGVTAAISGIGALSVKEFGAFEDTMIRAFSRFQNIDKEITGNLEKSISQLGASLQEIGPKSLNAFDAAIGAAKEFSNALQDIPEVIKAPGIDFGDEALDAFKVDFGKMIQPANHNFGAEPIQAPSIDYAGQPEPIHIPRHIVSDLASSKGYSPFGDMQISGAASSLAKENIKSRIQGISQDLNSNLLNLGKEAFQSGSALSKTLAQAGQDITKGFGNLIPQPLKGSVAKTVSQMADEVKNSLPGLAKLATGIAGDMKNQLNSLGSVDMIKALRLEMSKQVRDISTQSLSSPLQLAKAVPTLFKANYGFEEATGALPIVERFAVANQIEAGKAAEHLTQIQSSLKMRTDDVAGSLEQLARITDVVSKATAFGKVSVEEFSKALEIKGASAAVRMGISIEELGAYMLALSDAGIKGQQAGMVFETVLRQIQLAEAHNPEAWGGMQVKMYDDVTHKALSFVDVLEQINANFAKAGTNDQEKIVRAMGMGFNQKTLGNVFQVGGRTGQMANYQKELEASGGFAEMMRQNILQSFASQWQILKNNIDVVAIELGEILAPIITKVNSYIMDMVKSWRALEEPVKEVIVSLVAVTGGLLLAGLSFRIITGLAAGIGFAFYSLLIPLRLIGMGFSFLIGIAGNIYSAFGLIVKGIQWVGSSIASIAGRIWKAFVSIFDGVLNVIGKITQGIVSLLVNTLPYLWEWAKTIGVISYQTSKYIVEGLTDALTWMTSKLTGILSTVANILGTVVISVVGGIVGIITSVVTSILSIIGFITAGILALGATLVILLPIMAAIGAVAATIGIGLMQGFALLGTGLVALWEGISNGWSKASHAITSGIKEVGAGAANMWEKAKPGISSFFESTKGFLNRLTGFLYNFKENFGIIMDFIGTHWEAIIEDMGNILIKFIGNMASNIGAFGTMIIDTGIIAFKSLATVIYTYMTPIFAWVRDNWRDVVSDMGLIFQTLGNNLLSNFTAIFDLLFDKVKLLGMKLYLEMDGFNKKVLIEMVPFRSEEKKQTMKDEVDAGINDAMAIYSKMYSKPLAELKGPLEGLDTSKFKTGPGKEYELDDPRLLKGSRLFGGAMSQAQSSVTELLGITGGQIASTFGTMMKSFKSPLEGFESVVPENLMEKLNFNMPKGTSLASMLKDFLKGQGLMGKESAGVGIGADDFGHGQGKEFKDISSRRFLFNVPGLSDESKVQQVQDKATAAKLDKIAEKLDPAKIMTAPFTMDK